MDLSYKSYYNENGRYISIPEFYDGKSVFITEGCNNFWIICSILLILPQILATTFIGKLFIEKLLRSCPGIENIYVLIRPEKGECIQEIVDEVVLKSPIFDKLREARPNDLKKVVAIKGDMTMRFFGITLEDLELLKDKVSVILHSSFLYRQKESLKAAVESNLLPTKELIKMCHWMKKLDVSFTWNLIKIHWNICRHLCTFLRSLLTGIKRMFMRLHIHHPTSPTQLFPWQKHSPMSCWLKWDFQVSNFTRNFNWFYRLSLYCLPIQSHWQCQTHLHSQKHSRKLSLSKMVLAFQEALFDHQWVCFWNYDACLTATAHYLHVYS